MVQKNTIDFSDVKQERSKRTLEDLMQAAFEIVESGNPTEFTSRNLAGKAGYALGTLTKRLGSVENIFFWAIQKGRNLEFEKVADSFLQSNPDLSVQDFVEWFVGIAISTIYKVNPKVIRFYDYRYTKKNGLPADFFDYSDLLIDPYLEMCRTNKSNTFRALSKDEARFIFKAILALLERPIANGDPFAGTSEHRRICIDLITRMLAK